MPDEYTGASFNNSSVAGAGTGKTTVLNLITGELPPDVELAIAPEINLGVRDLRALAKVAAILSETGNGRRFLENAEVAFGIAEPLRTRKPKAAARRAAR